ncbi:hypothetical protein [Streptomyces sp. NPDC048157]|uniref:hypothetical protein n=1 Tax=Streptomyces sp. NPDC048157 TaxID=3365503 RepID=UPI00371D5D4F
MTDTRIEEIRARADAATPGHWGTSYDGKGNYTIEAQPRLIPGQGIVNEGAVATLAGEHGDGQTYSNARFAAHAREDVLFLLGRIAQLNTAVDRAHGLATRLNEFAESALRIDDRELYAAIAKDLRDRLNATAAPATLATDIHTHFSFSYANYLVLPRTLLQSMPIEWQTKFVALLEEFNTAFEHVTQAEAYDVQTGAEVIVSEMGFDLLEEAGIKQDWYAGENPPEGLDEAALNEWKNEHEVDAPTYYDKDGREMDPNERVFVADGPDPVPHYNRGRTRVEPRMGGAL